MKSFISVIIILLQINLSAQQDPLKIKVINPNPFPIADAFINVSFENNNINENDYLLKSDDKVIPFQVLLNRKGTEMVFVADFEGEEEKVFELHLRGAAAKPEFKSRTYAELAMKPVENYDGKKFRGRDFIKVDKIKVPSVHTDHDALFKYEGPGWESEIIGYRFYLDWRNANDIFGKKKNGLFLAEVGTTDTVAKDDSYHNMQEWGMDIFKVGNTLGIGSIGTMVEDSIHMVSVTDSVYFEMIRNGPVISEFTTKYFGWNAAGIKCDLISTISIAAGSRLTRCSLEADGDLLNITTGLAKFEGTEFIKSKNPGEWSYIGLYGNQSLSSPEDQLGIAVLYRTSDLMMQSENVLNYYVKLKPADNRLDYYFCAAWDKEEEGIKSKEEFVEYLEVTTRILNNPPVVQRLN